MSNNVNWTNEMELKLLQYIRNEPMLWNPQHASYKSQHEKIFAWKRISSEMATPIPDLKRKRDSLMASYRSYKIKMRNAAKNGRSYRPVWFAFDFISAFIGDGLHHHRGHNTELQDESYDGEEETIERLDDDMTENDEQPGENEIIIKSEMVEYHNPEKIRPKLVKKRVIRPVRETVRPVRMISSSKNNRMADTNSKVSDMNIIEALRGLQSTKKDECDSFGEYIANSLRKYDARTQAMMKQAINNIIFEQEMKMYGQTEYVVISENPLEHDDEDD